MGYREPSDTPSKTFSTPWEEVFECFQKPLRSSHMMPRGIPDWEFYINCPRELRLSAWWGQNWGDPLNPLNKMVLWCPRGFRGNLDYSCLTGDSYSLSDSYTLRNIFEILLNQPEIRLYLPHSDWFGTKRTSVWFHINRKMVNTNWFRFDSIGFQKYFPVC